VSGHFRNDDLLGSRIPEIVNPQATLGITRVTAVLYVPVGGMPSSLPVQIELIASAVGVPESILYSLISKASFAAAHTPVAIVVRQP
jgi:hypothetical protein